MRYLFLSRRASKEEIRNRVFIAVCISMLILSCLLMCFPTRADAEIYDNVIRFHVIANSDSDNDQYLKLAVRDKIIAEYTDVLSGYESKNEAEAAIKKLEGEINSFANQVVESYGYNYECKTVIETEYYNRTVYESFTMPAGEYTSLRIIIGEGEGKNWWCVLFPPLCTKAAMGTTAYEDGEEAFIEAGFTGEQYKIITETQEPKYRLKFKLLELLFG